MALGHKAFICGATLRGTMNDDVWSEFLESLIDRIGMTPFADEKRWTWPLTERGPNGTIIVRPITESFVALDIWPDHAGAYLHLCSCKPFTLAPFRECCAEFGIEIYEFFEKKLALA